ncbi:response regulator transcription factor [Streptomyces sp. NBC_00038]|uniref:response regulator transcription factor n=1 Tax=Streptomyces sp. NBC_00038 TaxID=2903615 RepID=UPI00224DA2C8|nr:response regulator transcription factor [Streptomyces sp. NBC_00038]MCX5563684.1 response regulator transcription factor [Streptomyces sp. NBC_00038]
MRQASADLLNPLSPLRREMLEMEVRAAPAPHTAWRVLIVDARAEDSQPLAEALRRHGHHVDRARNGYAALETYGEADVDIVLLDIDLPDVDGLQVCRQLTASGRTAVIALTARGGELDVVLGLQAGADDYLVKPCGLRELLARIEAVMRRVQPRTTRQVLAIGALRIDAALREVRLGGRTIAVTRKEFDLLYLLASRPETVVTREQLMREVWADSWSRRTVDTHVSSLRTKLGSRDWIITVHGVGFRIGRA